MTPAVRASIQAKLDKAHDLIVEASEIFDAHEKDLKGSAVEIALAAYYFIDISYEIADAARKGFGKKVDFMKNSLLVEMMENKQVKTVTLDKLGKDIRPQRFTVNVRTGCTMVDKDAGFEWLRKQGQEGLITETVNASSLGAFAKQWVAEKGADLPDAIFKTTAMKYVSVTKA